MSARNPQPSGYQLTVNRSNFFYVEVSSAWLYDCTQLFPALYDAGKSLLCISIYYQDTEICNDTLTRQSFNYDNQKSVDNKPQKNLELELDIDEHHVLTLRQVLRPTPTLFQRIQVQSAVSPNKLTAEEAAAFSNAEISKFWVRVLSTKHSHTTLELLGKANLFDF